jgi:hypothetical protein
MELYELKNRPPVFNLKINKPGVGEWDVVAVFNWSRNWTRTGPLSAEILGIPPSEDGYVFFDVWRQQHLGSGMNEIELTVPPTGCRVVGIRQRVRRPQFIGSSRHLTQGADDLESLHWNEKTRTLSGVARVIAGDPYRIHFTVPRGWSAVSARVEVRKGVGTITLNSRGNRSVPWRIAFRTKRR